MANETRERALRDLETPLEKLPVRELATLTNERHWLMSMVGGQTRLLDELWSSDVTELRAASLISAVQQEISGQFAEAERKRKSKPGRRR